MAPVGKPTNEPAAAASRYIAKGWYPIPLNPGTKECRDSDWLERIYQPEDFGPEDNVGIRLVKSTEKSRSIKLVGVDLDSPEAVQAALAFLPHTSAAWGRKSKPISQLLYVCPIERAVVYKDLCGDGKPTLLEVRAGHQSMAPPSVHPNGEHLEWLHKDPIAAECDPKLLFRATRLLATCAIIARHYAAPGARHDWMLCLAGTLRQLNLTDDEAVKVVVNAAKISGDPKVRDRLVEVRSTFARGDDDPLAGPRRLLELMPDAGKCFLSSLRKVWEAAAEFVSDDRGRVTPNNQENIRRALTKMGVSLFEDAFANRLMVRQGDYVGPLDDATLDRTWLEIEKRYAFLPKREYFDTVVRDTARRTPVHPVRDYLAQLRWDKKPRIDRWLTTYARAEDSAYVRSVGAAVLIAAIRRVMRPGCKFDELLVLESPQGWNKSSALRALCPEPAWFSDDLPLDVDSKEVIERTSGKWILEAAELSGLRRGQVEQLKAMLSRQTDGPVRLAYARMPIEVHRQFIVIGTTNSKAYLKDPTGGRRFWPVPVSRFDVERVEKDRDQLWAEAAEREAAGASIRLEQALWPAAAGKQEERRVADPWESALDRAFPRSQTHRITPDEVWRHIGVPVQYRDQQQGERVEQIMSRLGFRRASVRPKEARNMVVRGYARDPVPEAGYDWDEQESVAKQAELATDSEPEDV